MTGFSINAINRLSSAKDCSTLSPDEENDKPPKKKLKGLEAILKHSLSLPTIEISSEEKVEQEMRGYQDFPTVAIDVDPLRWSKVSRKTTPHWQF